MSAGGRVVVLEGNIGVGKSSLSQSLLKWSAAVFGASARVVMILENIDDTMLKKFLENPKQMAFGFQMYAACARIETMREAERLARQGNIVLVDRGLLGDATFAKMHHENGYISDDQWACYASIMHHAYPAFAKHLRHQVVAAGADGDAVLKKTHVREQRLLANYARDEDGGDAAVAVPIDVVYLRTLATVAFQRMQKRSIKDEVDGYTLDYFEHLGTLHDQMLRAYPSTIEIDFGANYDCDSGCFSEHDTVQLWHLISSKRTT